MADQMTRAPKTPKQQTPSQQFHIVGIGASAGGLEALETFFAEIPSDTGAAFVVVQHLSPDFKSHMEELLGRQTSMSIYRVEDGMTIEPNSVYLIPPKMEMVISAGKLLLTEQGKDRALSHPIDQFFRSLAVDAGRHSVGVVLSGTGSDGSRGIRGIHDAGGFVVAQDEHSAQFDGMPMNARATGIVDLVLPPQAIATAIGTFVTEGLSIRALQRMNFDDSTTNGMDRIFQLLHGQHGLDFSHYKASTVGRRVQRRVELLRLGSIEPYIEQLESDPAELNNLYKDLLIGVTRFFRDTEAFDSLERQVIPNLFRSAEDTKSIRIWVAGCASGEEAYSIAILIDEEMRRRKASFDVKIFATDAHHGSLHTAAKGVFGEETLNEMSESRRARYFEKRRDGYHVKRELRQYLVFAPHNLIHDAPFTQIDLVTCRNLLIYLQPLAQRKALSMFHFALRAGGTLFLGPSETPGELIDEFEAIDNRWRIYTKRREIRLPLEGRLPLGAAVGMPRSARDPMASGRQSAVDPSLLATYDQLLATHMPPSVLISKSQEVLHVFGAASEYLQIRPGRPSANLLHVIHESLKTPVTGAVQHAIRKQDRVQYTGVQLATEHGEQNLKISVEPVYDRETKDHNLLVTFEPTELPAVVNRHDRTVDMSEMTRDRIVALESELQFTQENLQATVEEMQTANEELQATNEELVASNEELQSTNEELHSVNEELYTVNAEHQRRVEELALANQDMDNLLATTRVGVIFIDDELFIRRFTPEVARLFHLVPHDVGRSISGFINNFSDDSLLEDLQRVLKSGGECERNVKDRTGVPYLIRMLPYRSGAEIEGVVLTMIDVSALMAAQSDLERFKYMCEASHDLLALLNSAGEFVYVNPAYHRVLGYSPEEFHRRSVNEFDVNLNLGRFAEIFQRAATDHVPAFESELRCKDGALLPVESSVSSVVFGDSRYLFVSTRDIRERRETEYELRLQKLAAESATSGIVMTDPTREDNPITYANPGFYKLTGYTVEEVIGRNCRFLQGPESDPAAINQIREAIENEQSVRVTLLNYRKDRSTFWNDLNISPVRDHQGRLVNFVGVQHDISESISNEVSARTSADRMQMVLNSTVEGIYGIDMNGICTFCNRSAVRMLGYEHERDLIGQNMHDLIHHSSATGERCPVEECQIYRTSRENVTTHVDDEVFWRADGTSFDVEYWSSPKIRNGRVHGAVVTFQDITERRSTEEKLRRANRAANRANQAKSEFLANMSHELRTPMTAVLGFTEMLEGESDDPDFQEKLATIRRNGRYLLSLLNDILDLSKIEAGKMEIKENSVLVAEVIRNVNELMTVRAKDEGIPLYFEATTTLPKRITADRVRVRQVLVNLIANALKFTDEGEVRVQIRLSTDTDQPELQFAIRDTGIGIDEEHINHLFKPFTQAAQPAQQYDGTGLGLSISKRLAEGMGGRIDVQSTVGKGSCFTLSLPVEQEQLSNLFSLSDELASQSSNKSRTKVSPQIEVDILLADDRRDVWRVVKYFLEKCGARVTIAEDGQQAIDAALRARAENKPFAAVLMDMQMPVMSGREAVIELRRQGFQCPIIALTADAMHGEREACIEFGCDEYLPKPIDGRKLIELIASLLNIES